MKVLDFIKGSDSAITTNGLANGMGTKIFDYLYLNKPTLCFVPKNSVITQNFYSNPNVVVSEEPHSYLKAKDSIDHLRNVSPKKFDMSSIPSRQNSAKMLGEILDSICMK